MQNYLQNNITIIDEFCDLYADSINIDDIIERFVMEKIVTHSAVDYARFRVFLDNCLLLLNRERINEYYDRNYSVKDFLTEVCKEEYISAIVEAVKEDGFPFGINDTQLYYPLDGQTKAPWNQLMVIRNAMAHMQYGQFHYDENGMMMYYYLYNKDKGIRKNFGVVIEQIVHEFVHRYFSNYSYGALYKCTFFSNYSFEKKRKTVWLNYYEIESQKDHLEVYNGYNIPIVSIIPHLLNNPINLGIFIQNNQDKLLIRETPLFKAIDFRRFIALAVRYRLEFGMEWLYGIKAMRNFETEISNFLVHISHLNEALYEYCLIRANGNLNENEKLLYKQQIVEQLAGLKEDKNAKLLFRMGFMYLKIVNFALRIEDDDSAPFNYSDLDVSMFVYSTNEYEKYIRGKEQEDFLLQKYIVERVRNAIMHGHLKTAMTNTGDVQLIFVDRFNQRTDEVKTTLKQLNKFLNQPCLYKGVCKDTPVLLIQRPK